MGHLAKLVGTDGDQAAAVATTDGAAFGQRGKKEERSRFVTLIRVRAEVVTRHPFRLIPAGRI